MKRFQKILSFFLIFQLFLTPCFAQSYGQALGSRDLSAVQRKMPAPPQPTFGLNPQYGSFGAQGSPLPADQTQMFGQNTGSFDALGYQVHILGQVVQPGTYRLPPSTRLAEALRSAGGPLNTGSRREIELRRKGSVEQVDLAKFELEGSLQNNPFLLDNDVIFVPFASKNVQIAGPVKHPGTFEMTSKEHSLADLLAMSGGYTSGVLLQEPLTVIRYVNAEKKLLQVGMSESEQRAFELQNGDVVVVPHVLGKGREFDYNVSALPADNVFYPSYNDNVYVLGAVAVPGAFSFNPHFTVQDFLHMSGVQKAAAKSGVYVLRGDGTTVRGVVRKKDFLLSPGDTIVVPERAFRSDNVLKWYTAITSGLISWFTVKKLSSQ